MRALTPALLCAAAAGGSWALAGGGQRLGEPPGSQSAEAIRRDLADAADQARAPTRPHEFYFTRAVYTDHGGVWDRGRGTWAIDYPKADRQFLFGLRRLTAIDAYESEHPVRLDDPELARFPFLYMREVGYMDLTEAEARGLRRYLTARCSTPSTTSTGSNRCRACGSSTAGRPGRKTATSPT